MVVQHLGHHDDPEPQDRRALTLMRSGLLMSGRVASSASACPYCTIGRQVGRHPVIGILAEKLVPRLPDRDDVRVLRRHADGLVNSENHLAVLRTIRDEQLGDGRNMLAVLSLLIGLQRAVPDTARRHFDTEADGSFCIDVALFQTSKPG